MNKLEAFLERIRELSDPINYISVDEAEENLADIHELIIQFIDENLNDE